MIDRFGLPPDAARHCSRRRTEAAGHAAGIRKLVLGAEWAGRLQFEAKPNVDPMTVIRLDPGQPKHRQDGRTGQLRIALDLHATPRPASTPRGLLTALAAN